MPVGHVTDPNGNAREKNYGFLMCDDDPSQPENVGHMYQYLKTPATRFLTAGTSVDYQIRNIPVPGSPYSFEVAIIIQVRSQQSVITIQNNLRSQNMVILIDNARDTSKSANLEAIQVAIGNLSDFYLEPDEFFDQSTLNDLQI
jgi:hypothetical protein